MQKSTELERWGCSPLPFVTRPHIPEPVGCTGSALHVAQYAAEEAATGGRGPWAGHVCRRNASDGPGATCMKGLVPGHYPLSAHQPACCGLPQCAVQIELSSQLCSPGVAGLPATYLRCRAPEGARLAFCLWLWSCALGSHVMMTSMIKLV